MEPQRKTGVSLGQGLKSLMSTLDRGGKLKTAGVIEVWDDVVGPEIAEHTFVSGFKEGELIVLVDSPVWAAELSAMSEQLRQELEIAIGHKNIKSLRFNVSRRVSRERQERQSEDAAGRGYGGELVTPVALSESELDAVKRSVSTIENEDLRFAALRATVTDLEWKKGQEAANRAQAPSEGSQDPK